MTPGISLFILCFLIKHLSLLSINARTRNLATWRDVDGLENGKAPIDRGPFSKEGTHGDVPEQQEICSSWIRNHLFCVSCIGLPCHLGIIDLYFSGNFGSARTPKIGTGYLVAPCFLTYSSPSTTSLNFDRGIAKAIS